MKALIVEEPGSLHDVMKLAELPTPEISPTQVLIEVRARPVNPSDELFVRGIYRKKPVYPQIAGLEGSGRIVQLGDRVSGYKIGEHVAFRSLRTWADYCPVQQADLIRIDPDIPFEISCQVGLNALTAVALMEEGALKKDDFLLLSAASSSVARLVLQLAVDKGIRVLALTRSLNDEGELLSSGAGGVLTQDDPELSGKIRSFTAGAGINAFFDAVGGRLSSIVIPCMAPFGRILLYGNYSSNEPATFTNGDLIYRNLLLMGFGIDRWMTVQGPELIRKHYQDIIRRLARGTLSFRRTTLLPMEDFPARRDLPSGDAKLILTTGIIDDGSA